MAILLEALKRHGSYIRIQSPITLPKFDEPEPDGAIINGPTGTFRGKHPGPKDITCVIEVSDSSLAFDRSHKQRAYAEAGIQQYLIINLVDGVVEAYTEPDSRSGRYFRVTPYSKSKRVELRTATRPMAIAAAKLLP